MVEDGVLRSAAFQEFSKDYVMFLHVTSMIQGRKDDELLMRIGGAAFPHLVVMDVDGSVVREHSAAPSVEAFKETGAAGRQRLALRKKAAAGDRGAILEFALARAAAGQTTSRKLARAIARAGELSPAEDQLCRNALTTLRFDEAKIYAQGAWFARMLADGLVPEGEEKQTAFYLEILKWAELQEDVATYERALKEMRRMHGEDKRAAEFFAMADRQLAELKAAAAAAEAK
jgi:hypothetical protein